MTCFRIGPKGTLSSIAPTTAQTSQRQPLVAYSSRSQDRANLMTIAGSGLGSTSSVGLRRRRRRRAPPSKSFKTRVAKRRKRSRVSKVRIVKGRVTLRLSGQPGVQHIGAGQLVRFVPLNKLRAAAQRVLNQSRRQSGRTKRHRRRRSSRRRR